MSESANDMQATQTDLPASTPAPPKPSRELRVTGKVRAAIDAMVWRGLKRADAAQQAGLKDNSLYVALSRPDVKSYYLGQLEVLRTSERARNIHRLVEIRDKADNMPAVNAIKMLEQLADEPANAARAQQSPGLVIVVQGDAQVVAAQRELIDVTPAPAAPIDTPSMRDEG